MKRLGATAWIRRPRIVSVVAVAAAAALVAAVAAVLLATRPAQVAGGPSVTIDPGLEPRMSAAEVTVIAEKAMALMAAQVGRSTVSSTVEGMTAVKYSNVQSVEPNAGLEAGERADAIVWVVRGTGTFSTFRGLPVGALIEDSGYLVIDDETGTVVAMGMP